MYSNRHSPSNRPSPYTEQKKRTIPNEHKDILKFIMFQEQGGALSKVYRKGLKRNNGDLISNFWPIVANKLNEAVDGHYKPEVMICIIEM